MFWRLDLTILWRLHFINVIHVSYLLGHVSEERNKHHVVNPWVQFSSVTQSYPTLCDPMDGSIPGLPVHQQLPEFTQTHFCWVDDAIQSFYPLSFPSPPASNLSQHQGSFQMSQLFTSGSQSIAASTSASVFPMNIRYWFPLGWTGWISLQSKGLSTIFSNTAVQKHQFFSAQLSL